MNAELPNIENEVGDFNRYIYVTRLTIYRFVLYTGLRYLLMGIEMQLLTWFYHNLEPALCNNLPTHPEGLIYVLELASCILSGLILAWWSKAWGSFSVLCFADIYIQDCFRFLTGSGSTWTSENRTLNSFAKSLPPGWDITNRLVLEIGGALRSTLLLLDPAWIPYLAFGIIAGGLGLRRLIRYLIYQKVVAYLREVGGSNFSSGGGADAGFCCVVCQERKVCFMAQPCKHVSVCEICVLVMTELEREKICVICRRNVSDYERIFLP